jgi:hypothetical protein
MSEIKVNKLTPRTNCGTVTLGDSGDTFTIPSGVTISNAGTAAGFGSTGEVSWNTTKITADPGNAVSGVGYFCDTSGGAFNVTLPTSPSAGDVVAIADYANTFDTYACTVARNGENIEGAASDYIANIEGIAVTFVYVDGTKGWIVTNTGNSTDANVTYNAATVSGSCNSIVTSGDYKTAIFKGPGTFCVSSVSSTPSDAIVDYFVVAGGGGGFGGGGGAGGFRMYSTAPGCNSPLNNYGASPNTEVTITATAYPITVGGGGAGTPGAPPGYTAPTAAPGDNSIFSTVTSTGGGRAGSYTPPSNPNSDGFGGAGGSGGGGGYTPSGGASMCGGAASPVTAPVQGHAGGLGRHVPGVWSVTGGAGGAGGAGTCGTPGGTSPGGAGSYIANDFIGPTAPSYGEPGPVSSTRYFSGGGAGDGGTGGVGGGGDAYPVTPGGFQGVVNTGGGSGGGYGNPPAGGTGGSGIVMIRYKFQ